MLFSSAIQGSALSLRPSCQRSRIPPSPVLRSLPLTVSVHVPSSSIFMPISGLVIAGASANVDNLVGDLAPGPNQHNSSCQLSLVVETVNSAAITWALVLQNLLGEGQKSGGLRDAAVDVAFRSNLDGDVGVVGRLLILLLSSIRLIHVLLVIGVVELRERSLEAWHCRSRPRLVPRAWERACAPRQRSASEWNSSASLCPYCPWVACSHWTDRPPLDWICLEFSLSPFDPWLFNGLSLRVKLSDRDQHGNCGG